MQTQRGISGKLTLAAPAATEVGRVVEAGDAIGLAADTVAEGARVVLHTGGEHGTVQVIAKEAWTAGQRAYWHETAKAFTVRETHWPVGRVGADKAADAGYGAVQLVAPDRKPGEVIAPFDYGHRPDLGVRASYTLRAFGGPVRLVSLELVSSQLTPTNARIRLGDGTGDNDQVLGSTLVSALTGFDDAQALQATMGAVIDRLVLQITAADLQGGYLCVRLAYTMAT